MGCGGSTIVHLPPSLPPRPRGRTLSEPIWQRVMQMIHKNELLQLARCSHRTRNAASDSAAWAFHPPLPFTTTHPKLLALLSESLLQYAPIRLNWQLDLPKRFHQALKPGVDPSSFEASHSWTQPPVSSAEISRVLSIPRLIELDASCRQNITQDIWQEILPHGALRQMNSLSICDVPPPSVESADATPGSLSQGRLTILQLSSQLQMFSQLTALRIAARDGSHVTLSRRADQQLWHLTISELPQAQVQLLLESSAVPPVDHLTLKDLLPGLEGVPSPGVLSAMSRLADLRWLTLVLIETDLQRWSSTFPFATLPNVTLQCIPTDIVTG